MKIHCLYDKLVAIKELKAHPKNPNTHSKEQIERLAKILEFQGWRYPVKVSKLSGFVTSGHGRIEAAKRNGWKTVPVNYQDYENSDQEYADLVSDNSIAEWSDLDLKLINQDFTELGPGFDIELLGIKSFVIDLSEKDIELINKGSEHSEWVDLPEFEKGDGYIKLIFHFKNLHDREVFVEKNKIPIDMKKSDQWIVFK